MESLDILSDLLYGIPLRVYTDKDRLHLLSSPPLCKQITRVPFSWTTMHIALQSCTRGAHLPHSDGKHNTGTEASPTSSMAAASFTSSSGQMSGQCVNPKYSRECFPCRSLSVKLLLFWSTSSKGPPMAATPTDSCFALISESSREVRADIGVNTKPL